MFSGVPARLVCGPLDQMEMNVNHDDLSHGAPDAPTQDEQLTGLQLAVNELLKIAESNKNMGTLDQGTFFDRRAVSLSAAADAIRAEHAQRLTLQHHAADLAQTIAQLEARVKRLAPTADDVRYTADQDWTGLPGSTAFLLIERHADGWGGIGDMMEAWRDSEVRRVTAYLVAESEAKIPAMQAAFEERLMLDRANRLLVKRIADLETKCDTLKRLHDAATDERDEWRRIASAYSPQKELSTALEQAKASGRQARKERDAMRARLAAIARQAAEIERLRTRLAAVNIAAHSLASRLTGVAARSVNGKDLIDRGEVIELTMRWRSMWDEAVRDPE